MVVNELEFFNNKIIVENFNKFFSEIGPKLASKISHSLMSFEHFLHGDYRYDEISSDVIKHISPSIFETLRYFQSVYRKSHFPRSTQNC